MGNSHTIVKLKEGKLWYIDESKIENLPSTERLQLPMGLKGYLTEIDFLSDTRSLANNSNNVKIYSLSDRNDRTTGNEYEDLYNDLTSGTESDPFEDFEFDDGQFSYHCKTHRFC